MCRSGYCFANFQSALEFLRRVDHTGVKGVDEDTFTRALAGHGTGSAKGAGDDDGARGAVASTCDSANTGTGGGAPQRQ